MNKEQALELIKKIEALEVVDNYDEEDSRYLTPNNINYSVDVFAYFELQGKEYTKLHLDEFVVETKDYYYNVEASKGIDEIWGSRIKKGYEELEGISNLSTRPDIVLDV